MQEKKKNPENKGRKKRKHRRARLGRRIALGIIAAIGILFLALFIWLFPTYKEYTASANEILMDMDEDTFGRAGNTYVYDADDNLIGEIGTEKYGEELFQKTRSWSFMSIAAITGMSPSGKRLQGCLTRLPSRHSWMSGATHACLTLTVWSFLPLPMRIQP